MLILAAFPVAWFKPQIERWIQRRYEAPATIVRINRLDRFSLHPVIEIQGLAIGQPAWAGTGQFVTLRSARMRLALLPLLQGRFHTQMLILDGLSLDMIRRADGRKNWTRGGTGASAGAFSLEGVTVANSRVRYRDAKQARSFDAILTADPTHGVRLLGTGKIRGSAVHLAADGGGTKSDGRPWPFHIRIEGKDLDFNASGTMARPLDMAQMTADMTARGSDLKMLDALIEAGLFGTQPIDLKAHVRHDAPNWMVTGLAGTIGGSHIAGAVTVRRQDGRTRLDGEVNGGPFSFDDLASDAGIAQARAIERQIGKRILPGTRIALDKLGHTDGTIRFRLRGLTGSANPPFTSATGTLTLDHSLITLKPIRFGLSRGTVEGTVTVDQRSRTIPLMTVDLTLGGATLDALAGRTPVHSGLRGRIRLVGSGRTIRDAVGRSNGTIAIAAQEGMLPARLASLLGFDVGRGITTDADKQSRLNCAVFRLGVRSGVGTADPLVVDTSRGQTRGEGTVSLATEKIAIRLSGAPKQDSLLRFPGNATLGGTLSDPHLDVPQKGKSAGALLKMLGRAITGRQGPLAPEVNCPALIARALASR
nr:AsmA family protein [Sphingomonas formosensis]